MDIVSGNTNTFILPSEISDTSTFSKYYQIYTQLKKEIFFGTYNIGERFFSLRELKKKYNADPRTLRAAVELLINDGFIENRPSSGVYINSIEKRNPYVSMGNIWFYQPGHHNSHPYYYGILTALQKQAIVTNQNVIVNHVADIDGFKAWFKPESGDGLIITGEFSNDIFDYLSEIKFTRYIVLGNYDLPEGIPNLHSNIEDAVKRSIGTLKEIGRKKLTVLISSKNLLSVRELMDAVYKADREGDIEYIDGVFDFKEDGYLGMKSLNGKDFDSIIVSESSYPGFCRYVYENNISCPDDIFVIRYGKNIDFENFYELAGLTIVSDKDKMVKKVMENLFYGKRDDNEVEVDVIVNDDFKLHKKAVSL